MYTKFSEICPAPSECLANRVGALGAFPPPAGTTARWSAGGAGERADGRKGFAPAEVRTISNGTIPLSIDSNLIDWEAFTKQGFTTEVWNSKDKKDREEEIEINK